MDRLEDIMSALLNFWYFRTMRMAFYEQILSEEVTFFNIVNFFAFGCSGHSCQIHVPKTEQ